MEGTPNKRFGVPLIVERTFSFKNVLKEGEDVVKIAGARHCTANKGTEMDVGEVAG